MWEWLPATIDTLRFQFTGPLSLILGFETASSEIYLTRPVLFLISIPSEVYLISDVAFYFEMGITFEPLFSILCAADSTRSACINRPSP